MSPNSDTHTHTRASFMRTCNVSACYRTKCNLEVLHPPVVMQDSFFRHSGACKAALMVHSYVFPERISLTWFITFFQPFNFGICFLKSTGDYPPPPPPVVDTSGLPSSSSLPPPPLMDESAFGFQVRLYWTPTHVS